MEIICPYSVYIVLSTTAVSYGFMNEALYSHTLLCFNEKVWMIFKFTDNLCIHSYIHSFINTLNRVLIETLLFIQAHIGHSTQEDVSPLMFSAAYKSSQQKTS